ncbi:MAG: NAD(P)-binding domain-containing protein [Candidatus Omnitrophica bacterium]|nr:NAD(P)-binding domain-containing protein [Candidatus Omnitrophota bacterium]
MEKFFLILVVGMIFFSPSDLSRETFRRVRREPMGEPIKELSFVGLGRMGQGMAKRLRAQGFRVIGVDINQEAREELGGETATSLREAISQMPGRKVIWLMLPHEIRDERTGATKKPVDETLSEIKDLLKPGDIIIDGGNIYYKDTIRRAEELKKIGVYLLDVGTSGGARAAEERGLCFMVGGDKKAYQLIEPLLKALAWIDEKGIPQGYGRVGPPGTGHYVKAVVHNSIEYGFFQGLAEILEILGKYFSWDIDKLRDLVERAQNGPLSSWTLSLAEEVFSDKKHFEKIGPKIGGGEYGRWGMEAGKEFEVDTSVIASAVKVREDSLNISPLSPGAFADRIIAGMRFYMGGHTYEELETPITPEMLIRVRGTAEGIVKDRPEDFIDKVLKAVVLVWLEALKEGYELMLKSPFEIDLKILSEINRIWKNGAVIRSYLVEQAEKYFRKGKSMAELINELLSEYKIDLMQIKYVLEVADRLNIPVPALKASMQNLKP